MTARRRRATRRAFAVHSRSSVQGLSKALRKHRSDPCQEAPASRNETSPGIERGLTSRHGLDQLTGRVPPEIHAGSHFLAAVS
jgi:hypothetical protein